MRPACVRKHLDARSLLTKGIAMSTSTNVSVLAHRWLRFALAALAAIPLLGPASCASSGTAAQGDDAGSDDATEQPDVAIDTSPDRSDSTTPHDSGSSSGADTSVAVDGPSSQDGAGMDGAADDGSPDAASDVVVESGALDVVLSDAPCGGCGPRSLCYQNMCIGSQRVFVSSAVYTGDLGGSPGADTICGTLATHAGLSGTWMAWVADGTNPPPSMRFYKSGPYRTLNGAVVALNFPALTTMDLFDVIDIDETGASQASSSATKAWTGTTAAGDAASQTCAGFTAGDASSMQGEVGNLTSGSSGNWDADGAENCNKQLHIYCFEQ
jgi:hypothetical protein